MTSSPSSPSPSSTSPPSPSPTAIAALRCPVCAQPFTFESRRLVCNRRHAFDQAREGYFHLLPAKHGSTKRVGDEPAMLAARRRVFDAGVYDVVAAAVSDAVVAAVDAVVANGASGENGADVGENDARDAGAIVVDAGCGEGFYGRQWMARRSGLHLISFDLAKEAVRMAAKRAAAAALSFVGDSTALPLADHSVDVVVDVFAPRSAEFARVLRPGGQLVIAIPRATHLHELQAQSGLSVEPDKDERVREFLAADFDIDAVVDVDAVVAVDAAIAADVVTMTPHHRHRAEAFAPSALPSALTFAVRVLRARRR